MVGIKDISGRDEFLGPVQPTLPAGPGIPQHAADAVFKAAAESLRPASVDRVASTDRTFRLSTASTSPQNDPAVGPQTGAFNPATRDRARRALTSEARLDPNHEYAQEKDRLRRQLGQLGIELKSDTRILVRDLDRDHGRAVARTIAGQTGLARNADLALVAPDDDGAYEAGHDARVDSYRRPQGADDPSVHDYAKQDLLDAVASIDRMGKVIGGIRKDREKHGDRSKLIVNMSYGLNPNDIADETAERMLTSAVGTKLHTEALKVLGEAPRVSEDGKVDAQQAAKLKRELIFPAMEKAAGDADVQRAYRKAHRETESQARGARDEGILLFQAAGNAYEGADAAGYPEMSALVTSDIDGIFTVGATDESGRQVAHFSSEGNVQASIRGTKVPVGDGNAELDGTSFASPRMAETAWVMSAANPKLSVTDIERLLRDPRVAEDIDGTDRDGAGNVDPLKAVLVAKNPNLTHAQLEAIRRQLENDPEARFELLQDGTLRSRGRVQPMYANASIAMRV